VRQAYLAFLLGPGPSMPSSAPTSDAVCLSATVDPRNQYDDLLSAVPACPSSLTWVVHQGSSNAAAQT
jgi:hypothetical protein